MVIYLRMGKTYMAKTPLGDFKITTPKNPLLSQQAITNKGISILYNNLQLNPYPNTQLDLFCSDNLSFQCMTPSTWLTKQYRGPSTWLTHQLLAANSSIHPNDEDQEAPWLENLWHKDAAASTRNMMN